MVSTSLMQSWIGGSPDASILTVIEAGVVAMIEEETGRVLQVPAGPVVDIRSGGPAVRGALTASLTPPGLDSIVLREAPADPDDLTNVEYRSGDDWQGQTLTRFELDGRRLYALDGYPEGRRNVRVTYTFGYVEDAGPPRIQMFILNMVKHLWERRKLGSARSVSLEGIRVEFSGLSSTDVERAGLMEELDALRRPVLVGAA